MAETMRRLLDWRVCGCAVLAIVVVGVGAAPGRAAAPPQAAAAADPLPALLNEVHGLRVAMKEIAATGPRVQVFVARLQLEEGRINTMLRRLDTVRDNLAAAQRELDNVLQQQSAIQTRLRDNPNDPHREDFTGMLGHFPREIVNRRGVVSRLSAEETQLTQDIAAEQTRWTEINQRLDEMERGLVKR
jgi:hypothetical protein